jgi:Tfp pilus assembly protein PilO
MTRTRQWSILTALLVLGVLAAGWFVAVAPKRSDAADLRSKAAAQNDANASQVQQIASLRELAKNLPAERAVLSGIRRQLPDNPSLPTLIRDLTKASRKSGTDLVSLAPSAPAPVAAPASLTPSATGTAVVSGESLYAIPLVVTLHGTYFELEQFLNSVEGLQRSMLVSSIDITPTASEDKSVNLLTLSMTSSVFMRTAAPAVAAPVVAAPAAGASTGTTPATSQPTATASPATATTE